MRREAVTNQKTQYEKWKHTVDFYTFLTALNEIKIWDLSFWLYNQVWIFKNIQMQAQVLLL